MSFRHAKYPLTQCVIPKALLAARPILASTGAIYSALIKRIQSEYTNPKLTIYDPFGSIASIITNN
jgi:hypothetical protein